MLKFASLDLMYLFTKFWLFYKLFVISYDSRLPVIFIIKKMFGNFMFSWLQVIIHQIVSPLSSFTFDLFNLKYITFIKIQENLKIRNNTIKKNIEFCRQKYCLSKLDIRKIKICIQLMKKYQKFFNKYINYFTP